MGGAVEVSACAVESRSIKVIAARACRYTGLASHTISCVNGEETQMK